MKRIFLFSAVTLLVFVTPVVSADPMISFGTIPSNGAISGPAGSTIGWGYSITNDDSALWVAAQSLNTSTAFTNGVFDTNNFDLPVIAPGQTVSEAFAANSEGLAELTWDADAALGSENSGVFELSLAWYTENPILCGFTCTYGDPAQSFASTPYSALVAPAMITPEPSTGFLLAGSLLLLVARGRRLGGS
jgi:hypothetical protein